MAASDRVVVLDARSAGEIKGRPTPQAYLLGLSLLERAIHVVRKAGYTRCLVLGGEQTQGYETYITKRKVAPANKNREAIQIDFSAEDIHYNRAALQGEDAFLWITMSQIMAPAILKELLDKPAEPLRVTCRGEDTRIGLYPSSLLSEDIDLESQDITNAALGERLVSFDASELGYWQPVRSKEELKLADKALERSVYKPMDNLLARANRKVSIPITRLLLPFPITANMVSIAGLFITLYSAYLFGVGGYWPWLWAAFWGWFASMVDGVDGEIARFKHEESAFGCWLETVCDDLYYVVTFAGITVGLYRLTGDHALYIGGGVALVGGALLGAFLDGRNRQRFAGDDPSGYSERVTKMLYSRKNPLLTAVIKLHHVTRRSVLPQVLFVFAAVGGIKWFFWGAVGGANIYWLMCVYNTRVLTKMFAEKRESTPPLQETEKAA